MGESHDERVYEIKELGELPDGGGRYGVLGWPVSHSLSPAFQRAGFAALGIAAQYVKIAVPPEGLAEAVAVLKERQFSGWNCTLPHKVAMYDLVDERAPSAERLGGVNTVARKEDGRLCGFNTDGEGWLVAIRESFQVEVRDLRVMILGAGGAGRGLAVQAALEKCRRLVLVNRTIEKARELHEHLRTLLRTEPWEGSDQRIEIIPWDEDRIGQELGGIDLLVNATSVGLRPADSPLLPASLLLPSLLVYDTIYRPARTRLLQDAAKAGARVANGLGMLLHQGAASLSIWTGREAPTDAMRTALNSAAALS